VKFFSFRWSCRSPHTLNDAHAIQFLSLTQLGAVTGDKVSAFADADEGAGKGGEGKEKGQKGVNVTDVYAFNDAFK
jgi:hypothetical protein